MKDYIKVSNAYENMLKRQARRELWQELVRPCLIAILALAVIYLLAVGLLGLN